LNADIVFKAVGQAIAGDVFGDATELFEQKGGKLLVNDERKTSLPDVWAGGDCIYGHDDLTVTAVQDGKVAANSIDRYLPLPVPPGVINMADLTSEFLGVKTPNPFWLASAPPTDKAYNVQRAFEAGWGGAVWKTLGEDPPIVNVSGPRYGAIHSNERRVIGFNNIELITDRPLQTNLDEIRQLKKDWPDRAIFVSVMFPMNEETWAKYVPMIEDTGADGFELNFGCPHGMSERGMGAAVGQVPEYIKLATQWCKKFAETPVIVKLTPNVANILPPASAAWEGGADGVSLINTVNSIMRVDYDSLTMYPATDGMGSHGGYCGQAVKAHGGRDCAHERNGGDTDLRYRRHCGLARCCRFPGAWRIECADLYGGHGLRLQDHRRSDRRTQQFSR
jgi:dihydroorotate dehydrogenase